MNKLVKRGVTATAFAALMLGSVAAFAEATANAGFASNYLWRGETLSLDQPYVFGGVDYDQGDGGFYAGLFTSSLTESEYETDFFGGYKVNSGAVSFDLGVIAYQYPAKDDSDSDFSEFYLKASERGYTFGVYYTDDYDNSGDSAYYYEIANEVPLKTDVILGIHYGWKEGDYFDANTGGGYGDFSLTLSKGEFALMLSDTDNKKVGQTDNRRVAVSWTHELDL